MPTKERMTQYEIVSDLKKLSNETDHLITENTKQVLQLDPWFAAIKATVLQIKNCNYATEIEYPKPVSFYLGKEEKHKNVDTAETQREHVHASPQAEVAKNNSCTKEKSHMSSISSSVSKTKDSHFNSAESNESTLILSTKVAANLEYSVFLDKLNTPQVKIDRCSANVLENDTCKSQNLLKTPILNRTFNKTLVLDSDTPFNSCQKPRVIDPVSNDNSTKTESIPKNKNSNASNSTGSGILTRSGSKNLYESLTKSNKEQILMETPVLNGTFNKAVSKTHVLDSGASSNSCQKSETVKKDNNTKSKSGSKNGRSGTKRRSSTSKSKSRKKQKIETPLSNPGKSRKPLVDKNVIKTVVALSENNCKTTASAVIVPPVQKKSLVSKEELIMKEIKKKDEKTNENIKRILAERQMKAEQNKKNREERRARLLEKRMLMEKEKEERLQKAEAEAKKSVKENVKNIVVKTRAQELIDQHAKATVPGVLTASKQNVVNSGVIVKTPARKNSDDCESYELTPVPNSSTYNFSDSEDDEKQVGKPIPLWAQGVHLKYALVEQYHNPPNLNELFGTRVESPDLVKMFSIQKQRYLKRTSSAVWNNTHIHC